MSEEKDPRIKVTNTIWGNLVAVLALCIPLSIFLKSMVLPIPIFAVLAAGLATAIIWLKAPTGSGAENQKTSLNQSEIDDLQERLANLEQITATNRELDKLHRSSFAPPKDRIRDMANAETTYSRSESEV